MDLRDVLMSRDGMTGAEADDAICEAIEMVQQGADPEEVLRYEFGLEPDYLFDLLP